MKYKAITKFQEPVLFVINRQNKKIDRDPNSKNYNKLSPKIPNKKFKQQKKKKKKILQEILSFLVF